MNFFIKNMKNRYSDPDPIWNRIRIHFFQMWIRIHFFQMWIRGSGSTITERWIRGSWSTFPKCGSQDPDPRQNEMDPKRWIKVSNHCHSNLLPPRPTFLVAQALHALAMQQGRVTPRTQSFPHTYQHIIKYKKCKSRPRASGECSWVGTRGNLGQTNRPNFIRKRHLKVKQ